MQTYDSLLEVRVSSDLACFTRPEMKVERVSYPVMTPSAGRGVLDAIFWKPEITWQVREIWVLKEIRYFSILRNEVSSRASERSAASWQVKGGGYDAPSDRQQRHTLALRDVDYLIRAELSLKPHATDDIAKYRDQFRRRVADGRCYHTPYLGCREFSAHFEKPHGDEQPVELTENLGLMLHDLIYQTDGSGRGRPQFFEAKLEKGVMKIPPLVLPQTAAV